MIEDMVKCHDEVKKQVETISARCRRKVTVAIQETVRQMEDSANSKKDSLHWPEPLSAICASYLPLLSLKWRIVSSPTVKVTDQSNVDNFDDDNANQFDGASNDYNYSNQYQRFAAEYPTFAFQQEDLVLAEDISFYFTMAFDVPINPIKNQNITLKIYEFIAFEYDPTLLNVNELVHQNNSNSTDYELGTHYTAGFDTKIYCSCDGFGTGYVVSQNKNKKKNDYNHFCTMSAVDLGTLRRGAEIEYRKEISPAKVLLRKDYVPVEIFHC